MNLKIGGTMKTKKIQPKLALNKRTIASLNHAEMREIHGGGKAVVVIDDDPIFTFSCICITYTCPRSLISCDSCILCTIDAK
jgi:hypothetical protein